MKQQPVTVKVPPTPEHLGLLRTVVGYYAGRENFTLDQIDDLRMAVDEAGVQLLRHVDGDELMLELHPDEAELELRLGGRCSVDGNVIDKASFSWQILSALSDKVEVLKDGDAAWVIMLKRRHDHAVDQGDRA